MNKKVIIVGGVAGGASAAARLRRIDEKAEIILFERDEHISFANCGLPYYIGGVIEDRQELLVQTPKSMESRFNITVKIKHEVIGIHRNEKKVTVKELDTGRIFTEEYDYLILSPGAEPIKPPIQGVTGDNVFTLRNIPDTDRIKGFLNETNPNKAVVIGGGFIGLEMAENLHNKGLKVNLVEMADHVMPPMDYEMAAMVQNYMRGKGIKLYLKERATKIENHEDKTYVVLGSGKRLLADMVILSVGVKPNTELAVKAGLELGMTGGIKVNEYLRTSDESIYAIGDAIEVTDFVTQNPTLIPLAGPANKQGRIVADNIAGRQEKYDATQGTSIVKIFDLTVACTGSNEKMLKKAGIEYKVSYTISNDHAGYYPGAKPMTIKIIFTPDRGKLLGAQIVGYEGVDKRIDILSVALRQGLTVFELQEMEFAYAPPFGSAKDPVNMAGFAAGNLLDGLVDSIQWHQLDGIGDDVLLLDVREEVETQLGKIEGSVNIPLNSLRDSLHTLDKEKKIIVYCAVGLRAYIACRILMQNGFKDVKNLAGGYKLYSAVIDDKEKVIQGPEIDELSSASNPEEGRLVGERLTEGHFQLNACGLQCPGPIMQVSKKMEGLQTGDILEVIATDPGFKKDIAVWSQNTGNILLSIDEKDDKLKAVIKKGTLKHKSAPRTQSKTMVIFSGELDRAIASFVIANGAAAMGDQVTLFFTFWGLNIIRRNQPVEVNKGFMDKLFSKMMPRGSKKLPLSNMNMFGLGPKMIRNVMKNKGVDSLEELISQAKDNGVKLLACQMSMDVMGIKKEELIDGVEIGGVATFLGAANESNMTLFI